ncbi:protein-disulfide isomerase [Thalassotalea mangrovi]|uniref:Protein-disulfide isomerase n=1 Tax=Thalassotalea mangrovi TaxID=2572245 RepID=A0A4U1B5H5_9GAMM|nr:protein-disulfide isomerase [Thalassotalea mangrovi]TKB45697.1 protein-disulfide isomerase [Thalassotalea mangrovi]
MNSELFFIYDSHCPWSYATTPLVKQLVAANPEMHLHLFHVAHYDGSDGVSHKVAKAVANQSTVKFGEDYLRGCEQPQDATVVANLMAWLMAKQPDIGLEVLEQIQDSHFQQGLMMTHPEDFEALIKRFKLSIPGKVFKDKLSKDAEYQLSDIAELQDIIQTTAFPALLVARDERIVLLNHNLYLTRPDKIVEAVTLEFT